MSSLDRFQTRPGRIRAALIGIITLTALLAILHSGLPTGVSLLASVLVAAWAGRVAVATTGHRISLSEQALDRVDAVGGRLLLESLSAVHVTLRLLHADGHAPRLILFADEFPDDGFRRLRARLRNR
ncbi:MAG: hypothetical protein RQ729_03260 [Wenzhouxiangellaceae bacterium]|nr:hypothetical protein [Wenzhouxiangellaceae bacterium]